MGYVHERDLKPNVDMKCSYLRGDGYSLERTVAYSGDARTQYGYRSVGTDEVLNSMDEPVTMWNKRSSGAESALIRLADATNGGSVGGPDAPVWERQYYEEKRNPVLINWEYQQGTNPLYWGDVSDALGPTGAVKPTFPMSDKDVVSEASNRLRALRPTRPDFDLTRFIGELRDLPRVFNSGNYVPESWGYAGQAHLNMQFGVLPTLSDIQKGAAAVLQGDKLVREFAVKAAQRSHRTSRIPVATEEFESPLISGSSGGFTVRAGNVDFTFQSVLRGSSQRLPFVKVSGTTQHEIRVFATYEWFVGDPDGFVSKLDAYKAAARKVLGGGLTLSALYELTPWSWMQDWFYDIGGLLAYQQDVADSSLVMTRGGYVTESIKRANAIASTRTGTPSQNKAIVKGLQGSSYYSRNQIRKPGSPYSLNPTWDLNPFQWGIAAALGLTKATNNPFWKI